jgi:tetratricopeptide (TPR) repeat protein
MKTFISRTLFAVLIAVAAVSAQAGAKEDIQADMQAGRWTQADTRLTDVLSKHPDNALAQYWQAQVKYREGQFDEARQHLAAAKEIDPKHAFAADKGNLAKLEAALDKSAAPAARTEIAAPRAALPAPIERPPVVNYDSPAPAKSGSNFWMWVGLIALAGFIFWAVRSAKNRGLNGDRATIKAKLEEALNDLRDAGRAIDARAELSMEQRLALSDRVVRAQGDVQAHLATMANRSDLTASVDLLRRVRDIAAEVRGERRPSEIEAERALEMQRMQNANVGNQGVVMGNQGSGLGGVGAALGGLAAGVALGSLMGGSSSAHARGSRDDGGGGYTPIEDFDQGNVSPGIDVGGSGDGGGWDSGGSSDTGGGGGGDFD